MATSSFKPGQKNFIVFIDGLHPYLQSILSDLDPAVTAIVLDPEQDGIKQMADALAGLSGLDAICIISHGGSGQIKLGKTQLKKNNLAQFKNQLATIGQSLSAVDSSAVGSLCLYGGCGKDFSSEFAEAADAVLITIPRWGS